MQCNEIESRFTDYVNDSLPQPDRSEVQEHLTGCAACAEEFEALKSIWASLGSIRTEAPDHEVMRARFDVMLDAYRQGLEHRPSTMWWKNVNTWMARWWPQQPVLQFGLALALLTVGVVVGHQNRP